MSAPTNLAVWTLGADIALMGSIVLFVYRVLRNPTNPKGLRQLGELEGTIRSLIREAEGAGKSLNDQLIRRQESLEKILFDLEACEKRTHRVQSKAEETRGSVDVAIVKVQKGLDALNGALTRFQTREQQIKGFAEGQDPFLTSAQQNSAAGAVPVQPPVRQSGQLQNQRPNTPEQPAAHWYEAPDDGATYAPQTITDVQDGPLPTYDRAIAGFTRMSSEQDGMRRVIPQPEGRAGDRFVPLSQTPAPSSEQTGLSEPRADSIHRKVMGERLPSAPRITREQLVQAQSLIQQGVSVEEVIARSGLAPEQVKLLVAVRQKQGERRMAVNRASTRRATVDPRLGVLGGSRR